MYSHASPARKENEFVMNKVLGLLAVGGLLLAQATAGRAVTLTINTTLGALPAGVDWTTGVNTPGDEFTSLLFPVGTNNTQIGLGSTISFGQTQSKFNGAITTGGHFAGTYTAQPTDFQFVMQVDSGPAQTFTAHGVLNGTYDLQFSTNPGDPFDKGAGFGSNSNVTWTLTSLFNETTATPVGTVPVASAGGFPAQEAMLTFTDSAATMYNVLLDIGTPTALTSPFNSPLSEPGYQIGTAVLVPEPGSMAMMVGSGLMGSLLLRRRRRA
jgi:hypothetical protein